MCLDSGKNVFRRNPVISLFSQQDSLGGHGDSAEMPAAIAERFANHGKSYVAEPFVKIGTQMLSSAHGRVAANVVLLIDLPPWIKDGAGRRLFQQSDEPLDRLHRHKVPKVPNSNLQYPSLARGRRLFVGYL